MPPAVHIRDNLELRPSAYRIVMRGAVIGEGECFPGMFLAINPGGNKLALPGTPATDPAFGLPAIWIEERQKETAHRYMLGSRSAVEWIMDRYQVRTDKKSGIVNDPNDWANEIGEPRYILDLLGRIVTVSVETMAIVDSLPGLVEVTADAG